MKGKKNCGFCGESAVDENLFYGMQSSSVICLKCISKANVISEYSTEEKELAFDDEIMKKTPKDIKGYLDRFVVGQDYAKKILAVALFNHLIRVSPNKSPSMPKSNIMLIGNSGVGKTLLIEKLSEMANIPFVIMDATTLTQAGYSGDDASVCIKQLLIKADGDISRAEKGIVFIDEVDKIAAKSAKSSIDVSGRSVQQSLLKLIEGKDVPINTKGIPNISEEEIIFNTKNTLFISGGAFDGIRDIVNEENKPTHSIGFGCNLTKKNDDKNYTLKETITDSALITFGMIPEFIGRYPLRVSLHELSKDDMKKIIMETEGGVLYEYNRVMNDAGVTLIIPDNVIEYAIEVSQTLKVGARSIQRIFQPIMDEIIFEVGDVRALLKIELKLKNGEISYSLYKKDNSKATIVQ